jgi:hypothetical protein
MAEIGGWQARPQGPMYDALRVEISVDAVVGNKAILLGPGVLPDGTRTSVNPQRRASLDKEIAFDQSR